MSAPAARPAGHGWWAYLLPMFVFLGLGELGGRFPEAAAPAFLALKVLLEKAHDPFDTQGLDPTAYQLYPLIYSAGPAAMREEANGRTYYVPNLEVGKSIGSDYVSHPCESSVGAPAGNMSTHIHNHSADSLR